MSISSDIQDTERQIETAGEIVARREMALRLSENRDFRKLFIEGWLLVDAARLVQMSTDTRLPADIRESALEEAKATGYMKRFLSDIVQIGWTQEQKLPELHSLLAELRAEDLRDDQDDEA